MQLSYFNINKTIKEIFIISYIILKKKKFMKITTSKYISSRDFSLYIYRARAIAKCRKFKTTISIYRSIYFIGYIYVLPPSLLPLPLSH